jgi:zinc protease
MKDLEGMKHDDLKRWYDRFYAPNNAILVVVGDVRPAEVFAQAEKYFGPVPRREDGASRVPAEPAQTAERRLNVKLPAEVPHLMMGYHVPVMGTKKNVPEWEPYALTVAAGVLDGGDSARFTKELVREQKLAADIDVDYSPSSRAPTLFILSGTPAEGHTVAELDQALRKQLERLRAEPVTDAELRRIKAQVVAADVYGRDSVFNQAMQLGRLAANGLDIKLLDQYVERINRVTAQQVQEVARKYLVDSNLTVGVLEPLPLGKHKAPRVRQGGGHAR